MKHICGTCSGTGEVDSGGFYPWGYPINIECPDCSGKGVVDDDDLTDCPIPRENDRLDAAQRHYEQRGG